MAKTEAIPPRIIKTKEYLKCEFTKTEIEDFSKQLAQECREKDTLEDEKKEVMSDFKAKIDGKTASISKLSGFINTGFEYRNVDCETRFHDPTTGKKTTWRKDNGEKVKTENMTSDEMQEPLPLGK